ncbi:MAG: methylenetetrahydrofolate reductase [NAD(P)H] [Deltaproteobacteria bacterium]|jgi:methylenetetrahydrofolate reductase (NADPH)|nr:methylenetetrahydrofolate reductase [NAD(P)H] [Deltaproteobacteria bacterium]MBQ31728.1 methylenetetrahydrofolate reductase [NAD(P)H] [Deltaproteobacteria bacterium]MDP7157337.1 methylenetetrahydrofolate reductase [SAR324 cluster bacterium]
MNRHRKHQPLLPYRLRHEVAMRLIDLYRRQPFVFSIEVFPAKTEEGMEALKQTLGTFAKFRPDYFSVTYGAGGSTRENTHTLATHLQNTLSIETMAHLTCVSHTCKEIEVVLYRLEKSGIENVMALRGDPPQGSTEFQTPENGYSHASELVAAIRERGGFGIGAAGYPEGHTENPSKSDDRRRLVEKINAGADFVATQFFLDNTFFLHWRDRLATEGVSVPLVPGLLVPTSLKQITRMADFCGIRISNKLRTQLETHHTDPEAMKQIGLEHATHQLEALLREGIPGLHLYALNKLEAVQYLAPLLPHSSKDIPTPCTA